MQVHHQAAVSSALAQVILVAMLDFQSLPRVRRWVVVVVVVVSVLALQTKVRIRVPEGR
jgi:hypothetical protein